MRTSPAKFPPFCKGCIEKVGPHQESQDAIDLTGEIVGVVHVACAKAWRLKLIENDARRRAARERIAESNRLAEAAVRG